VADINPLGLDTKSEQAVALGGQVSLIGGAPGVPDKELEILHIDRRSDVYRR